MSSPSTAVRRVRLSALALCTMALVGACSDGNERKAESAERARQMRDVARMLDAMEVPPLAGPSVTDVPARAAVARASNGAPHARTGGRLSPGILAGGVASVAVAALAGITLARRRRRTRRPIAAMSIAACFGSAAATPAPAPAAADAGAIANEDDTIATPSHPPGWSYRRTTFEAPTVQLTLEPVDLLSPGTVPTLPADAMPGAPSQARPALFDQLHAPGTPAVLYLSGERHHPAIRHVGGCADDFAAWEVILRETVDAPGDDGRLARWLLPALLHQRAARQEKSAAAAAFDEAVALCRAALESCPVEERPWWLAHSLRAQLARLASGSGASRLLALRALGHDTSETAPPALDAWIDIHLAWAGWLVGNAARERLGMAYSVCERMAAGDPARALRRRAEVMLRHAALDKGEASLIRLDHAQALLESAARAVADPATLLLIAECAHRRAALLSPAEAAEACSFALAHAFSAGTHAAWRTASLEMRLAIQATHDSLPGHAADGDITAALRRELADARSHLHPGYP